VVLIGILGKYWNVDPSLVGLIVAMAVSFSSVFLANGNKEIRQYLVAFFNGFLIYVTVIGFTNFTPYFRMEGKPAAESGMVLAAATATPAVVGSLVTPAAEPQHTPIAEPAPDSTPVPAATMVAEKTFAFEVAIFSPWIKQPAQQAQTLPVAVTGTAAVENRDGQNSGESQ